MNILEHVPLAEHTTFKIGGPARYFCVVTTEDELVEALMFARQRAQPFFILGGGSNLLVSDAGFAGLVVKIELKGVQYDVDRVRAAAGEMWDDFVEDTLVHELVGLENLSAIPGTVGAVPVQNIGAYGAEASQVIESVRALDTVAMRFVNLTRRQCRFEYRDSVFKREKGRYVVTEVTFKLKKHGKVNIEYRDVAEYFRARGTTAPTPLEVRQAVIEIRWGKLPDWKLWGTAGSFFKNPIVSLQKFIDLKQKYPDLPGFPEADGQIKVSLGWILDKVCNVRGVCVGNVCTYEKQALVIVAQPGATAAEVVSLTKKLMDDVKEKTGIEIEAEVEWVN
ncbi:MAG: UDP-N-acetylmuramate dehydrogenase [Patescibacteria group bacterium]|nr:UDP-N-acetylmuramate dehydrogenase [Patescibacteria group bacterium]MDE2172676.1 UDP-N-acetylmuramate dehydrogenase [Patescibacteria group bacterium]